MQQRLVLGKTRRRNWTKTYNLHLKSILWKTRIHTASCTGYLRDSHDDFPHNLLTHCGTAQLQLHELPPRIRFRGSAYLFLPFFEAGKSDKEARLHVLLAVELHRSLEDLARFGHVAEALFEPGVFDPVLHRGMDIDEWMTQSRKTSITYARERKALSGRQSS